MRRARGAPGLPLRAAAQQRRLQAARPRRRKGGGERAAVGARRPLRPLQLRRLGHSQAAEERGKRLVGSVACGGGADERGRAGRVGLRARARQRGCWRALSSLRAMLRRTGRRGRARAAGPRSPPARRRQQPPKRQHPLAAAPTKVLAQRGAELLTQHVLGVGQAAGARKRGDAAGGQPPPVRPSAVDQRRGLRQGRAPPLRILRGAAGGRAERRQSFSRAAAGCEERRWRPTRASRCRRARCRRSAHTPSQQPEAAAHAGETAPPCQNRAPAPGPPARPDPPPAHQE